MRRECLPASSVPHTTPLYRDFLSDFKKVSSFYAASPAAPKYTESARQGAFPAERRQAVAAVLEKQNRGFGASEKTLENIARLRAGAGAIVTGQQVALFGGPLYSILKAFTAIRHAQDATRAGVECVPIFWLATEDHDLVEVSSATFLGGGAGLHTLSVATHAIPDAPVGGVAFGPEITGVVDAAARLMGEGEASQLLRSCYRPGATFTDAFAKLFAGLFAEHGLIVLDPSDPALHHIASPLLVSAAEQAGDITKALLHRDQLLEAAGYHAQVKVTSSSTPLFAVQGGVRMAVHRANGAFSLGKEKLSLAELVARIKSRPEDFNGNALMRPVVQDFILPTVAYVGGPAEVAYFAQSSVIYEKLLGSVTPILPRISATLVDAGVERILKKYGLQVTDVFRAREDVQCALASRSFSDTLHAGFETAQREVERQMQALSKELVALDPTLGDAAKHSASKMKYQIERLRRRASAAGLRRESEIVRHAERLSNALFPQKDLQERKIAGLSLLGCYGLPLLQQLNDTADLRCLGHQVLYLEP